tara:strand:+ start:278 stop:535 length:258 start_codon:yes stop_codon:yes gene_type:complete
MPSSSNYVRNYKKEYSNDSSKRKKNRALNNKARRIMKRKGLVKVGDNKDVAHVDNNPRNNSRSNLSVKTKGTNRSYLRTRKGKMK